MTIYDIAKEAGVSASTVSRVINNRPGIKKSTREKIESILKVYNFSVSEAARGLVNQTNRMIGILVSDIRNQHHTEGAYMIERHFMKKGYCSLILNAGDSDESMAECVRILSSRRVDAVVLIGSVFQNRCVMNAITDYMPSTPIIFQNGIFNLPNVSSVVSAEDEGTAEAVKYLYSTGRKHIVYINGADTPSNRKKAAGYSNAAAELQLDEILYNTDGTAKNSADVTEMALAEHPEADAIIYATDLLAVGASRRILDDGKKIPEDIAIIGTDNSPFSTLANPRLSSIDTKLFELSEACSSILEKTLLNPGYTENAVIAPALVLRETTSQ